MRLAVSLDDYTGELQARLPIRFTDNGRSAPITNPPQTVQDLQSCALPPRAPPRRAPPDGAACGALTTADAVLPGAVREDNRAVWQLGDNRRHRRRARRRRGYGGQRRLRRGRRLHALTGHFTLDRGRPGPVCAHSSRAESPENPETELPSEVGSTPGESNPRKMFPPWQRALTGCRTSRPAIAAAK